MKNSVPSNASAGYCLLLALSLSVNLVMPSISRAENESATIVLHARDGFATCEEPQQSGLDCINGHPVLDIGSMQTPWIYVMLRNYERVNVLQCAFDWPLSWSYLGGTWDCQPGSLVLVQPTSPGPKTGSMVVAFNCVQGGALITVGRMIFGPPVGNGCLSIIESIYPFGTNVVSCPAAQATHVPSENRGRICAGPGGYDACWPAATPAESATWGSIKAQYP
jgi:hypothetical protein